MNSTEQRIAALEKQVEELADVVNQLKPLLKMQVEGNGGGEVMMAGDNAVLQLNGP